MFYVPQIYFHNSTTPSIGNKPIVVAMDDLPSSDNKENSVINKVCVANEH